MVTTQPELPERYRLWPDRARALLGRGGAGEVWRAQDQDLGVLVALKILRAKGAKLRTRLEREAALAARVVHPNVVSVHDMGRTRDDLPYLAFALASHGSMLELAANPPPWTELRPLLVQLLDALAALHARGVLHLDVKLSNLLLHRTGPQKVQLWLADLGVARALYGDEDDDQGVVGTVGYMAAERLVGKHHLWTPATDLFSVGAVAYRILCGKLPFSARNATEALAARQSPPIELPVRPGYAVPKGLDEVILPLLNPNRLARFDLAADVARALLALEDVPSRTPGPSLQVILDTPTDVLTNPVGFRPGPNVNGVPEWNRPRPTPPPSQVPQLHQPRRVPLAPTLLVHREIPMVGRNEALDQAWTLARKVIHDHQPLILHIRGARGAGRTRFVQELIRSLEQTGLGEGLLLEYAVREGPSLGLRGAWHRIAPPHDNPESQVRELAYLLARDQSVTMASALPDAQVLARWISPMGGDLPANAVAQSMLVDHLAHRSWRGLSWLWFEDAHLASYDDDAWPILEMILDRRAPILVLVTTRDDQPTDRLIDLSNRHPGSVHELDLGPLDIDACTRLVRALLPLESDLAGRLALHAHGSPRYLRELVLQWVRQGQLVRQHMGSGSDPVWTLAEGTPPPPKNRHEFAQQRLDHALEADPSMLEPLLTVALAGRGTPERVVARVVGEKLNALILDGLVTLERGMPVLTPPELPETIRRWPREEGLEPWIHEHLAAAWALEGDDPAVLARVGAHRAAANLPERALEPLDRALRALRRSLPVPEVVRLALLTMDVTERTVGQESSAWAHAAMALADATWFMGDAQRARDLYAQVEVLDLPHEDAVRAACMHANHLGREEGGQAGLRRLEKVEHLLDGLPAWVRAEYLCNRGWCRFWVLDSDAALDDFGDALVSNPDPETEIRCRLGRARLLESSSPEESFREAQIALNLSRSEGRVRYEAQAQGYMSDRMVSLGRATEGIGVLRACIQRVRNYGDHQMAGILLIQMGEVLRRAGQLEEARETYMEAAGLDIDRPDFTGRSGSGINPPPGDTPALAHANLALMAILDADGTQARHHLAPGPGVEDHILVTIWEVLEPIAQLLQGDRPPPPPASSVSGLIQLGIDGIFMGRVLVELYQHSGLVQAAAAMDAAVEQGCQQAGVARSMADSLMAHFESRYRGDAST